MLYRSLRSLAGRALAAGAASALTLTLFNAAQPSLGNHQVQPGTLNDVKVALTPVPTGPVRRAPATAATPATPSMAAASGTPGTPGTRLQSGAVEVGEARFVGFSWPDADPRTEDHAVFMRARTAAGWSGWREVEQAGDGPDATSSEYRPGRAYSDGQWLDAGTEEVQVRVDPPAAKATTDAGVKERQAATATMAAGGIEAHLITPDLTATPGTEAPRAGVATAATAAPRIISRAAWGAKESIRRASPDYSDTVKAAFVHHTVQSNRYSPSESAALVRSDYLYHVRTRGWNDIGYNFLVDRYGRVFEGRYGGVTRAVLGAHSGGFNTNSTGVALLGTFTTAPPPARMLAGLERLLAWKLDLTHVDPRGRTVLRSAGGANTRYRAGRQVVVNTIMGHRSTSYTTCPGDPTIARLGAIRRAVARIGRPKIYNGYASSSLISPERGGYTGIHARFTGVARWRVTVTGSNGGRIRSYSGTGTSAKVRWNGRVTGGALAPQGWATITVTAAAGGRSARPTTSRVFVNRSVAPSGTSTGGFTAGSWRVSNANAEQRSTSARVFTSYRWGRKGDIPVVGDWDGDGTQTVGVVRPSAARNSNQLLLRNSDGRVANFWYGTKGDRLVMGDWDGNGTWTPAAVRAGVWSIRSTNTTGVAEEVVGFGRAGDNYLAGDWDGDGDFTPGVQRNGTFLLRNTGGTGPAERSFRFGRPSDLGFAGDWDGNGTWTPGLLRNGTHWYLRNSFSGAAKVTLRKQTPGRPVVGNWDRRP